MKLVSIVVPVYNEEEAIPLFFKEISKVFNSLDNYKLELIFVDDGSKDKTLDICRRLAQENDGVHFISFSRNFGKEAAMYAGLSKTNGNIVGLMDVDLQDPPALIPEMLDELDNGYDVVATRRVTRKGEPLIRSIFARMFYKLMNKYSSVELVGGARDFRLMKRNVLDAILSLDEYNRFSKGIFAYVGFKTKWLEYENIKRAKGESKWSFIKLFKYAMLGITSFSKLPLSLSFSLGSIYIIASLILLIVSLVNKTFSDNVIIFLILLSVGIILIVLGIIGEYLANTYEEVKGRPKYIVREQDILDKTR